MHRKPLTCLLVLAGLGNALAAQTVIARDHIVALPPISICQDGATHRTVITNHRLRPNGNNLAAMVGKAIEIQGKPGAVTCKFVTLSSAKLLSADLSSKTSKPAIARLQVDFYGKAPSGSLYMTWVAGGIASTPLVLPGIGGPIHLDLSSAIALPGLKAVGSQTSPYLKVNFGLVPNVLGIDFYAQAVAVTPQGTEMTNIDKFRW